MWWYKWQGHLLCLGLWVRGFLVEDRKKCRYLVNSQALVHTAPHNGCSNFSTINPIIITGYSSFLFSSWIIINQIGLEELTFHLHRGENDYHRRVVGIVNERFGQFMWNYCSLERMTPVIHCNIKMIMVGIVSMKKLRGQSILAQRNTIFSIFQMLIIMIWSFLLKYIFILYKYMQLWFDN